MDNLFLLGHESRLRILQRAAARLPGCSYLCAWAALPPSSSSSSAATSVGVLCCVDAWLCDGAGASSSCRGDAAAAAGGGRRVRALFDAYRGSLCAAVSGCVPGWAYKDGVAFMELPAHDLTASASLPVQQQFYQEAGIKMAAFMGCESGEIEVGMSSTAASGSSPMSLESSLHQVFSEDFFQESLLEELLQLPPTQPSSPSSTSMPSVSVDSPAADGSTSLQLRTMTLTPPPATTPSSGELHVPPPPPPLAGQFFSGHGAVHHQFPSADADDAAMAEAMLAVISASSSPSTASATTAATPGNHHHHDGGARRWWPRRLGTTATAFRAYNAAALAPRTPWRRPVAGQRMINMGISILTRMHMLRFSHGGGGGATAMAQRAHQQEEEEEDPPPAPTSSQLNHMISERRRRERLNESFEALRGLLPPGSKKDKATVLAKTLDYMNILVAQIADLEARNRTLESRAHHHSNGGGGGRPYSSSEQQDVVVLQGLSATSERVQVHVTTAVAGDATTSSSSSGRPAREAVTVRVETRRAHGDVGELVARTLAAIKKTGRFMVVAVDATRPGDGIAHATFTLRATAGEFDEASLREAVMKAAEDSATPLSDDS